MNDMKFNWVKYDLIICNEIIIASSDEIYI